MDGGASDLELLLASVRHEIKSLKSDPRLKKLERGNRGRDLRQHVLDLIAAAEHQLEADPSDDPPPNIQESFDRVLRFLVLNLRSAHAAMPWLAATRSPQINLGTLYLAEECAEILVGKNVDLVIVPDPEYMYSAESWPYQKAVEWVAGFSAKTANRPVVLRYPLSDDNRLLVHAIFAHELSHPAVQEHELVDAALHHIENDSRFEEELVATVEKVFPNVPRSMRARTLRQWLPRWVEETLCDHLAADLTGPAFLCAFAGFVMPISYDAPSPSHPPNTVRAKLLLEQLRARGWAEYLELRMPQLTSWLDEVAADAEGPLAPAYSFLRDQLLQYAEVFRETSRRRVGGRQLTPTEAVPEANQAQELLDELILPVGETPCLMPRSILLGGWQHAIARYGDSPNGLVRGLADPQLQDLVGKAIELSVVVSCWEGK